MKTIIFVRTKQKYMTYQDTIDKNYSVEAMEAIQKQVDKAWQHGPMAAKAFMDKLPYDVCTAYSKYLFAKM